MGVPVNVPLSYVCALSGPHTCGTDILVATVCAGSQILLRSGIYSRFPIIDRLSPEPTHAHQIWEMQPDRRFNRGHHSFRLWYKLWAMSLQLLGMQYFR